MNFNKIALFNNVDLKKYHIDYQIFSLNKNHTLYNNGDLCEGLTIVLKGELVAYALSLNGNDNIIFKFTKDSVIGANLLFGDINKYPFNIYCTSDCQIIKIDKKQVTKLLDDHNFTKYFIRNISLNSQDINLKIAMKSGRCLRDNLIDYFKSLSIKQNSLVIELPISKKQLADYMGVWRQSLFRELKKMENDNLIAINNKFITIKFDVV